MLAWAGQVVTCLSRWMELVVVHWQGRLAWATAVASLYMAEAGLLAGLELVVWLVVVLVHVLQEVQLQGRWEWMRKIGVDHNSWGGCWYGSWGWNWDGWCWCRCRNWRGSCGSRESRRRYRSWRKCRRWSWKRGGGNQRKCRRGLRLGGRHG